MWSLSKRSCTLSKPHLSRRKSLFSVVVPIEAIGVVTAMEGNVATRGVSTAAAWVEVVELEKEVGQCVEVVVAAEARRALRSGVAMSFLICSGPRAPKALGLGDRMRARRCFKMRPQARAQSSPHQKQHEPWGHKLLQYQNDLLNTQAQTTRCFSHSPGKPVSDQLWSNSSSLESPRI